MKRKEINRQKAIDATLSLCLKHSFHGTSIDAIAAETGMSKATIYRHFNSKEHLIAEALEYYRNEFLTVLKSVFDDPELSLKEKLGSQFIMLRESFKNGGIVGSCFQNAHNEFCNNEPDISKVCAGYKSEKIQLTADLLTAHGISNALERATKGYIILVGLFSILQVDYQEQLIDMAQSMYLEQMGL
ncbi:TetR/AcrR family transcriptional regulator [Vibrio fluvialis]|uniref:TetR/AcrR family transcriptional regulator n=1 Tax=Vibrio fluvialis TaxID=676 RepID=UPI001302BEF1|nr:TetR/AcrR family transcriptional regulator [Vibrio fluvialis]EKO3389774.1 TetR/AcrR family transcriptional regulator [Vibrio fluvialis]EKO3402985.1 TetR/AcrR family transcriptional regulator [Vibrio fluvialis]EKO3502130.1 TetR/AcrR family transcriptional regulator [Vibrio fluvialis]EKO3949718.1 TetR/AcrR family transcriptional regulator [Vibrio fluvialis]EKO3988339.1 TetR/AcrR family transcriptional regulator [Vibrio fluvialis]